MKTIIFIYLICISLFDFLGASGQTNQPQYTIVNKIQLPGDGGWDYLTIDEYSGRLYISHSQVVQVVDTKSGKLIGTIPASGVHGIAIAPDLNKGFISNGGDASITVFNLQTLETITKVKSTGQNPDAILFDPFSKKVFAFNGRTSNVTVIDAVNDSIVATISLSGKPEFAVSDNNGKIFVNIEDKNTISVIYVKDMKVGQNWSILPGEEASGLDFDYTTHRLFAGCRNKLMVILNSDNGNIVKTLPIGEHCDGIKFDKGNNRVYSSNGDGTLTVVQEEPNDIYKVIANVATQVGARTLTVNSKNHHIYLSDADMGETPPATADNPHPRRNILPGTFFVMDVASEK